MKNFDLSSVASEIVEFPLFDIFYFNLAKFRDLDVFLVFDFFDLNNFLNFLAYSTLFQLTSNLSSLQLLSFFPEIGLLLLFPLKANLLPLFLLQAGLSGNLVIFNIEVNRATILLKLKINRQSKLAKPRKT